MFLLLAYCNYSGKDDRAAPAQATAGMTASQGLEYRGCVERSSYANLSDYSLSQMCRQSALGQVGSAKCHTEWDGRANPTVCE